MRSLRRSLEGALMRVFTRIDALRSRPVSKPVALCVVVLFGILVAVPVFAQTVGSGSSPSALDTAMLFLAGLVLSIAQVLGQVVVLLLDIIIIPLMQYNGFSSSPIVGAGWSITRDVVNMFFVIVLIAIAMGTIIGYEKRFKWHQQVPRLMIFALIINFSRTLTGLMIDFGQVIMLTFVNALKDIAGGNFIQLLGLSSILSVSKSNDIKDLVSGKTTGAGGIIPFDWLAAAIAAMMMMIAVLAIVIILAAILAWRIVLLWILVVMAPLAWFMGGAKDVIGKDKGYAEWWTNFTCAIAVGPVVTFFLWLTLAVAGSGNIAASEGFVTSEVPEETSIKKSVSGNLLEAFEVSRMTSFIIGFAMLVAGFQAANDVCKSVPGMGKLTKGLDPAKILKSTYRAAGGLARGTGRGMAAGAGLGLKGAELGVRGAAGVTRVGRQAGALAAKYGAPEIQAGLAKYKPNIANKTKYLGKAGRAELLGKGADYLRDRGGLGSGLGAAILGNKQVELSKAATAERVEAGDIYRGLDKQGKIKQLSSLVKDGKFQPPSTERGRRGMQNLLSEAMKDPEIMKELGEDNLKDLWGGLGEGRTVTKTDKKTGKERTVKLESMAEAMAGDPAALENIKAFRKSNPHLTTQFDPTATPEERIAAFADQTKIKNEDDLKNVNPAAFSNPDFAEFAKTIKTDRVNSQGRNLTGHEAVLAGQFGAKAKQSAATLLADGRGTADNPLTTPEQKRVEHDKNTSLLSNYTDGKFSDVNDGASVMHLAESNPVSLLAGAGSEDINTALSANDGRNEFSSAIVRGISDTKLAGLWTELENTSDPVRAAELNTTLNRIGTALTGYNTSVGDKMSKQRLKTFAKNRERIDNQKKVADKIKKGKIAAEQLKKGKPPNDKAAIKDEADSETAKHTEALSNEISRIQSEIEQQKAKFETKQAADLSAIADQIEAHSNSSQDQDDSTAWDEKAEQLIAQEEEIKNRVDADSIALEATLDDLKNEQNS